MKKFLLYLLFLILGVSVLDVVNRVFMNAAYAHLPDDSELKRNGRYVSSCDAELLVLGASRGVYDYNTVMMADSLNLTCQSIAMEGMSVISQYISVKNAVSGGNTRTIIYDLSQVQLSDDWVLNQMSRYYPYYWANEDVREFVDEQQGKKMKCLLLSSFVQYNSVLFDVLYTGYVRKTADNHGYIPLPYTGVKFVQDPEDHSSDSLVLNPVGEHYLQRIVDLCKANGIRLILCDSPRIMCKNQSFDDYLQNVADRNGIEFWNYSDYKPILSDMRYFVDPVHINNKGAEIFTRAIIGRLRGTGTESGNQGCSL